MRARFNGMKYRPSRRGDLYAWDTYSIALIDGCSTVQDETCIAVRRDCACSPARPLLGGGKMGGAHEQNAVCSVACLAWPWWIAYPPAVSRPGTPRELTVETMSAKEAKNRVACSGNHLGCSQRGRSRIAVRTQWQFGPGDGNIPARTLMGNPHDGDAWQSAGKANRTSSRKINSACRHFYFDETTEGFCK